MREALFFGSNWTQMQGAGVSFPLANDVATELAAAISIGEFVPPHSGGATIPQGAMVIHGDPEYVLGEEYIHGHLWLVTGDATTAAGWTKQ